METGIILNQADIKKIIAQYYNVDEKQIISSKYSFIVTGIKKDKEE